MTHLLEWTIVGLVSSSAMICFLWLLTGLSKESVDMVKAVGSIYTKSEDNAMGPGLFFQLTFGTLTAYIYGVFLNIFAFDVAYKFVALALVFGLVHGLAVAIVLATILAEHHPLKAYQKINFAVGFYHVLAHILYGLVIGCMYATFMI